MIYNNNLGSRCTLPGYSGPVMVQNGGQSGAPRVT